MILSKEKGSEIIMETVELGLRENETEMRLRIGDGDERMEEDEPDWMSVEVEMD